MKFDQITNSRIVQAINQSLNPIYLILNLASIALIINQLVDEALIQTIALTIIKLLPFFMAIALTYFLTNKIQSCVLVLAILAITKQNNLLDAIVLAIIIYLIDHLCQKQLFSKHFITSLPKFVEDSLKNIILLLTIIIIIVIFKYLTLPLNWLTIFDWPITCIGIIFLYCLLFYYGYHPALLLAFLGPIQILFLSENIQAFLLNEPLIHLFTHGSMSAFANLSGTGVTIGIALLSKRLPKDCFKAGWFGVNESVIFALPVTRNKKAFIPYVLGGTILGSFPFVLMALGYLNKPIFDAPYLGLFIEGFLVNLDWRSILVNLVQIIGSIIIWKFLYREENHEI